MATRVQASPQTSVTPANVSPPTPQFPSLKRGVHVGSYLVKTVRQGPQELSDAAHHRPPMRKAWLPCTAHGCPWWCPASPSTQGPAWPFLCWAVCLGSNLQQLTGLPGCRFFFRSGNIEHPEDKLFNTSVEVLPFDVSGAACGCAPGWPLPQPWLQPLGFAPRTPSPTRRPCRRAAQPPSGTRGAPMATSR